MLMNMVFVVAEVGVNKSHIFIQYLQSGNIFNYYMRRPGFEPGLPDWQSDVLDQTGRPSHIYKTIKGVFKL